MGNQITGIILPCSSPTHYTNRDQVVGVVAVPHLREEVVEEEVGEEEEVLPLEQLQEAGH